MHPLIAFDTALLAVPNTASDQAEAEEILERVIDWAECMRPTSPMLAACASDALDVLVAAGAFPSGPNIKALLELFNLEHIYSADVIRRAINRILERATPIIEIAGIEVLNCNNYAIIPEINPHYEKPVCEFFARLLASLLIIPYTTMIWEEHLYVVPGVS
jgi:hypothetical protein